MNTTKFFLTIALLYLGSFYLVSTIVHYEREIDCLKYEIEFYKDTLEEDSIIIDSLEQHIDSIQNRYRLFETKPAREFIDIMNAIVQVESSGIDSAYNASEDAVGILQIRQCMVDDVNRILKRKNKSNFYTYNDRWCRNKSSEMFEIFCDYYNLTTAEEMARCWNGGPRGINNPYTVKYWNKVEKELEESYASR